MPTIPCGECQEPCNCFLYDDGILRTGPSQIYECDGDRGRRNTIVSGQGTVNDPYTIEFIDSEFYRPEAGELQLPDQSAADGAWRVLHFGEGPGIVIYETPRTIFLQIHENNTFTFLAKGFFQFVGASATWASNTTGRRKIGIMGSSIENPIIAGMVSNAPSDSLTLSTSGFWPGNFVNQNHGGDSVVGLTAFRIIVHQDSGGSLNLSNIKFWMGSL